MAETLPAIDEAGLACLGIALPGLAGIRIALTGGAGGKYHVPVSDLRRGYHLGGCRYAKSASGAATYPLRKVFGEICKRCAIMLPAAPDALWRAAAFAAGRAASLEHARNDRTVRAWLGYARYAAAHQPGDDEQFDDWLMRARTDRKLSKDARTLAAAWKQLASEQQEFLEGYAADCPEVDAYNGAREAVKRSSGSAERHALDQVSAAVVRKPVLRARRYEPDPQLDVWQLVSGVWLAARSRGASAARAAELTRAAVARELADAPVVDVTRLPAPSTPGDGHASPAAWANHELALWWPQAVTDACQRLEAEFEAESADAPARLLLVHDWPLTGTRDAPIAYLAAAPLLGPVVPFGYRRADDYVSWNGGDRAGPSYSVVIAAPGHIVAKLEKEQAAQGGRYPRFVAAGPVTGRRRADQEAALKLLRTAFPYLPISSGDEPSSVPAAVEEQRRARSAHHRVRPATDGERASQIASSLSDGYGCWIPDGTAEVDLLKELHTWLRWRALRLDMWCGPDSAEHCWASLYGTLNEVSEDELSFSPGGRHRPVRIPLHWVVALAGARDWAIDHPYRSSPLWEPYEPLPAIEPPTATRAPQRRIRALPSPADDA